jgi:hypothetical protein
MTEHEAQTLAAREKTARSKALRFLRFAIRSAQEQRGKSVQSYRPNAPFAEFVQLPKTSIADEMRMEHTRRVLGEQ